MAFLEVIRSEPPEFGRCRSSSCGAVIEWVRTLTGKRMPLNAPVIVDRVTERLDGTLISTIDAARSHFATCPDAKTFRKTDPVRRPR